LKRFPVLQDSIAGIALNQFDLGQIRFSPSNSAGQDSRIIGRNSIPQP